MKALDPRETYLFLAGEDAAKPVPVTDTFWSDVVSGRLRIEGRLLAAFDMAEDWPHWEMHPEGEEILILLSGDMSIAFDSTETDAGGAESVVALEPGQACLVPRGVWHRGIVRAPSRLLAITSGEGTQHRPI